MLATENLHDLVGLVDVDRLEIDTMLSRIRLELGQHSPVIVLAGIVVIDEDLLLGKDVAVNRLEIADIPLGHITGDSTVTDSGRNLAKSLSSDITCREDTRLVGLHVDISDDIATAVQIDQTLEELRVGQISDEEEAAVYINRDDLACLKVFEIDSVKQVTAFERIDGSVPDEVHLVAVERLLTGDLIDDDTEDLSAVQSLIAALSQIAPVYASYGNHELDHQKNFHSNIAQVYTQAGATVLEQEWDEIEINGSQLRIGGIYSYCLPHLYTEGNEQRQAEADFLSAFQDTDLPTILLSHQPVGWLGSSLDAWDISVVFSGHLHGGQMILPGIGGLYAPDMGWFPGRLWGTYSSSDGQTTLVLSRGLGTSELLPRVNNIPEIIVADLVPRGA